MILISSELNSIFPHITLVKMMEQIFYLFFNYYYYYTQENNLEIYFCMDRDIYNRMFGNHTKLPNCLYSTQNIYYSIVLYFFKINATGLICFV